MEINNKPPKLNHLKGSVALKRKVKLQIKNTEKPKEKYPSASIMLEISMDEYTKERERSNILDNKANAFISVIIAIFTLYIPIIPFSKLAIAYSQFGKGGIVCVTSALCVMVASLILMIIAFVNLYNGFKIQPYCRVDFSNLNDIALLQHSENDVKKGLIDHYNTILTSNADINTKKSEKIKIGLKYSIIAFALLSISTIALIIMLGGVGNVG